MQCYGAKTLSASSLAICFVWFAAFAQDPATQPDAKLVDGSAKKEALSWIEGYRKEQVLFHDKDIERVHQELLDGSEEDAKEWLAKTKEIRAALDSERWRTTRLWLKDFLRVQAIYSDEQISEFRDESKQNVEFSADKFIAELEKLEGMRAGWTSGVASNEKLREQELAITEAYKQQAFAQREAARRASAASRPTTGATRQTVDNRNRRAPAPIVSSLDAARWSVLGNFWHRR